MCMHTCTPRYVYMYVYLYVQCRCNIVESASLFKITLAHTCTYKYIEAIYIAKGDLHALINRRKIKNMPINLNDFLKICIHIYVCTISTRSLDAFCTVTCLCFHLN